MKNNLEYEGHLYNDDRIFVLYIARCTEKKVKPGYLEYVIYHTNPPTKNKNPKTILSTLINKFKADDQDVYMWGVVTYRNTARYPCMGVKAFYDKEAAQKYLIKVEPTTPLVSLNGRGSEMTYDDFVDWKNQQAFKEYDYKKMYLAGGENPSEIVIIKEPPRFTY